MITYTPDANYVLKKWSTWLSIVAASLYSGAMAWDHLPKSVTGSLPEWIDGVMALLGVLATILVPLATSIQQKSIPVVNPDPYASAQSSYSSEEMP